MTWELVGSLVGSVVGSGLASFLAVRGRFLAGVRDVVRAELAKPLERVARLEGRTDAMESTIRALMGAGRG